MKFRYVCLISLYVMIISASERQLYPSFSELSQFMQVASNQWYNFPQPNGTIKQKRFDVNEILRQKDVGCLNKMVKYSMVEQKNPPIAPEVPIFWLHFFKMHGQLDEFRKKAIEQELVTRYKLFKKKREQQKLNEQKIRERNERLLNSLCDEDCVSLMKKYCKSEDLFFFAIQQGHHTSLQGMIFKQGAPLAVDIYKLMLLVKHKESSEEQKYYYQNKLDGYVDHIFEQVKETLTKDPEKQQEALQWLKERGHGSDCYIVQK